MSLNADTYGASLLEAPGDRTRDRRCRAIATRRSSWPTSHRPDLVLVPSEPYTFDDDHVSELSAAFP